MRLNKTLLSAAIIASLTYTQGSLADTQVVTGAAAQSSGAGASVDLDFEIDIPAFLSFRVGSAAGVDTINFSPAVADVLAPTLGMVGTGGDAGGSSVNVVIRGNGGAVDITESTTGVSGLTNGTSFIDWAQINTTETGGGGIPAPVLSNSSNNTSSVATTSTGVVDRSSVWEYTYDNPATVPQSGLYTGTATYTAAVP
jgi:hypothetical protein